MESTFVKSAYEYATYNFTYTKRFSDYKTTYQIIAFLDLYRDFSATYNIFWSSSEAGYLVSHDKEFITRREDRCKL